jgi:hypothetical protein
MIAEEILCPPIYLKYPEEIYHTYLTHKETYRATKTRRIDGDQLFYWIEGKAKDGRKIRSWFSEDHFGLFQTVSTSLDDEESRLRAILTSRTHSHDCRKCGAPLPCDYHS